MNPTLKVIVEWIQQYPYTVPMAVGFVVTLAVIVIVIRRHPKKAKPRFVVSFDNPDAGEDEDSHANRRSSVRREGSPVKVVLTSPTFRNGMETGYVVDRSTGGVRVVMTNQMVPGSTMQIRAQNAPENTPWVTVIIRNCKHTGQHYEVGCEFDRTPPWNVLLLFG
jgi:hypothetical protein